MSTDPAERVDLVVAIEHIGKITAVIASFSVIISVFYDYGFLFALDISFAAAPTTISDHVRSWVVWLPRVVTSVLFILAVELLVRRLERGATEEEIIKSSPDPTWTEKVRRSPYRAMEVLGGLMVGLWLLFGNMFLDSLFFGMIICWLWFIRWVFGHPVVRERHAAPFRWFIFWGPPLMAWFFIMGFNAAKSTTASSSMPHRIQMTAQGAASGPQEAHILRSFEKWLLVQEKDRQIVWVRSDDVRRIESPTPETPFRGLVCLFSDKLCLPIDSSKTK